ncbi:MAG: hypothetical protein FWC91_02045 [Defluviitaleaceae bacterium]|nr:hypothetical protein [Defluviitaleaceae bacterium]
MNKVTALKKQAFELLQDVPEDKMNYVILILKGLNGLLNNQPNFNTGSITELNTSDDALKAWEGFRQYKGIIPCTIDEKAELSKARDEKYARSN